MSILYVWGLPSNRLVGVERLESGSGCVDQSEILHGSKGGKGFVKGTTNIVAIGNVDVLWTGEDVVEAVFLCRLDDLMHEHFDKTFIFHFKSAEVEHI